MSVEYELPISSLVSARKHLPPSYHHTIIDSLNHHIVISTLLKISTTALLSCFSQSFHFSEWQRNRIASVRSMSLSLSCPLLTENKRETLYIFLIFMLNSPHDAGTTLLQSSFNYLYLAEEGKSCLYLQLLLNCTTIYSSQEV